MKRCACDACRARDFRRFLGIIAEGFTTAERDHLAAASYAAGVPLPAILGPVPAWEDSRSEEDGA